MKKYKVWLQIEIIDENCGESKKTNEILLDKFDNLQRAQNYIGIIEHYAVREVTNQPDTSLGASKEVKKWTRIKH
jgi:hypothetical protein